MKTLRMVLAVAGFFSVVILGSGALRAQTKRGVTPEDNFSFKSIGDPHISPDGKVVAYVLTVVDQKKNRRESSIWAVPADGSSAPRRLSAEGFSSNSPRWNPDGKTLAFLSARATEPSSSEKPKSQIYLLSIAGGGEALALTRLKNGVQSYQWSPEGSRIVVVSTSGPMDGVAAADRKSDVRHYRHIRYKFNDTGWFDDERRHLWVVNVPGGEAKQITEGQDWEDTDPQWSPDGTHIAFVSDRTGKAYDGSHNTDVWVIPATGGTLTKISDHAFEDENPRWSPDGKQILFTGQTAAHQFPKLYIADSSGGAASQLAVKNLDMIPGELHWATANSLLFTSGMKGETHIFRADLDSRTFSAVTSGPRGVHAFDVDENSGKMAYLANDFQHLDDLYISSLDGSDEHQLTHVNSELWAQLELQPVERLPYKSTDGWAIDGFFVKPLGWQPGKKYPMVLVIHGGPEGMFGVDWYHEFQVYAAKGWAVFFCNPRGSTGYGEKFERGEINNWGGMDYQDIMAGVDAALKQYPWIDSNDLGVTGGSYGGYMTNWIVSHTTRFKAAVTLRSIS
ncbi:MAG: S9 family peptidase, partial [Candidatus Acidiferrum sp.]